MTTGKASEISGLLPASITPKPRWRHRSPAPAGRKPLRRPPVIILAACGFLRLPPNFLPDLLPLPPPLQPERPALLPRSPQPEPPALRVRKRPAPAAGAENRPARHIHFPDGRESPRSGAAPAPG